MIFISLRDCVSNRTKVNQYGKGYMKLVRLGNIIVNMERLIAVRDDGHLMTLIFSGDVSQERSDHSSFLTVEGEACDLLRQWLTRVGIQELTSESPVHPGVSRKMRDETQLETTEIKRPITEMPRHTRPV